MSYWHRGQPRISLEHRLVRAVVAHQFFGQPQRLFGGRPVQAPLAVAWRSSGLVLRTLLQSYRKIPGMSLPLLQRELLEFLADLAITFARCDHAPVYTVEEARLAVALDAGARVKNLLAADKRGGVYLVCVPYEKRVDLTGLGKQLGAGRLSLASPGVLEATLRVQAGSVSLLALMFDAEHAVTAVVDRSLWAAEALQFHPMTNTATIAIKRADVERFLKATGHAPVVLDVPDRPVATAS